MADDKTNRGLQDRSRINLSEDYEVHYWTDKFGVSKVELAEAVREAGSSANAVERELRRKTLATASEMSFGMPSEEPSSSLGEPDGSLPRTLLRRGGQSLRGLDDRG